MEKNLVELVSKTSVESVERNLVELVLFHKGHIAVGFLDAAEQILLVHSRMKRSCWRSQSAKREILID
jgi:hypothetical protein